MPLYEFCCEACGPFEKFLSFGEAGGSRGCPACGAEAPRVYSMPGVVSVSAAERKARLINERGSEPKVVKKTGEAARPGPARGGGRPWQIGH
ncbi:FmdB family zinc ribbon protein [Rubrobacter marinus]|uniref:FmdB family zinc ribbon protein n=1 Tax=Rubrobacter marinus TaxID=2653852 RepID=UPI00140AB803|nr:zinc ribbon domain-containing protein [Rubrobacter marinus]